jgi:rod shape-determining protein MreC
MEARILVSIFQFRVSNFGIHMVAIPSRHKSLVLLAGVIVLQVLLLAVQIKRDSQGRLIRSWTVGAVSPFERAGSYGFGWFRDVWRNYFALRGTRKDNEDLRHENDALKLRIAQLEGKAAEADRLAALLSFRKSNSNVPMLAARVIGGSAGTASLTIELDRGERDGIRRNMGVITPDGVVGKVVEAYPNTAQVLLLTDKESGVGAKLADSGNQHPVGGVGEPMLAMKYVPNDDEVNVGERVVTSGMDRIFPRDLPVGTIAEVKPGNQFKQIRVKPAANLEKLEEVLVLLTLRPLDTSKAADPPAAKTSGPSAANVPPVAKP